MKHVPPEALLPLNIQVQFFFVSFTIQHIYFDHKMWSRKKNSMFSYSDKECSDVTSHLIIPTNKWIKRGCKLWSTNMSYCTNKLIITSFLQDTVFFTFRQPLAGQGLFIIEVSLPHSVRHTTNGRTSPGRVISPTQCPLTDNRQSFDVIRTRSPSKRMAHTHTVQSLRN